jgi:hypothetical protein
MYCYKSAAMPSDLGLFDRCAGHLIAEWLRQLRYDVAESSERGIDPSDRTRRDYHRSRRQNQNLKIKKIRLIIVATTVAALLPAQRGLALQLIACKPWLRLAF